MANVKFSVVAKKNPVEPEAGAKFYACAQSAGVQSLEDMSKVIEKKLYADFYRYYGGTPCHGRGDA